MEASGRWLAWGFKGKEARQGDGSSRSPMGEGHRCEDRAQASPRDEAGPFWEALGGLGNK